MPRATGQNKQSLIENQICLANFANPFRPFKSNWSFATLVSGADQRNGQPISSRKSSITLPGIIGSRCEGPGPGGSYPYRGESCSLGK